MAWIGHVGTPLGFFSVVRRSDRRVLRATYLLCVCSVQKIISTVAGLQPCSRGQSLARVRSWRAIGGVSGTTNAAARPVRLRYIAPPGGGVHLGRPHPHGKSESMADPVGSVSWAAGRRDRTGSRQAGDQQSRGNEHCASAGHIMSSTRRDEEPTEWLPRVFPCAGSGWHPRSGSDEEELAPFDSNRITSATRFRQVTSARFGQFSNPRSQGLRRA